MEPNSGDAPASHSPKTACAVRGTRWPATSTVTALETTLFTGWCRRRTETSANAGCLSRHRHELREARQPQKTSHPPVPHASRTRVCAGIFHAGVVLGFTRKPSPRTISKCTRRNRPFSMSVPRFFGLGIGGDCKEGKSVDYLKKPEIGPHANTASSAVTACICSAGYPQVSRGFH